MPTDHSYYKQPLDYEDILYEVDAPLARITLNRPERMNALRNTLRGELFHALRVAESDPDVSVIIIKGSGRCFSAGYDLGGAAARRSTSTDEDGPRHRTGATFDDDVWFLERAQRLRMVLFDMHKPVIAKVHGYCLAGGTDIALLTDMVIAADDAQIGFPPARDLGVLPNHMWLYNCGPQWAKRLMLTGDTISGRDAAKIGLVMKAVPADLLDREVDGLLNRLALIDPDLLAANKRIVNLGLELMGARTLQRLAAEIDARGHVAPGAHEFMQSLRDLGVREAVRARDGKFPDGTVRVDEPEIRDADGRFVDP